MTDMTAKIKETAETVATKAKAYAGELGSKAKAAATEVGTLTKENVAAVVESGKIGVKGTTELTKENVAFAKTSFEEFTSAAKDMAAVKNPSDFVKMQGDYLRSAMDKNVEFATKASEAWLKLVGENRSTHLDPRVGGCGQNQNRCVSHYGLKAGRNASLSS